MTTMDDKYGDGSDHDVCDGCGYCKTCGDCESYGCGKRACPNQEHMGEFACKDKTQCWEPCGELGKSEAHAVLADEGVMLNDGLGTEE